jgi:hypothetical protein
MAPASGEGAFGMPTRGTPLASWAVFPQLTARSPNNPHTGRGVGVTGGYVRARLPEAGWDITLLVRRRGAAAPA